MEPGPYELIRTAVSDERLRAYADLLSSVFPAAHKFTHAYLRWQYAENPDGTVVGYDAFAAGAIAAHYVTIPLVAHLCGEVRKGVLSLNTATHPEHQGRGLFTRLASATYDAARELGYDFVVGVANQNSTPGFLRKLGFTLVAPLDVRIGVGAMRACNEEHAQFSIAWRDETLTWRLANPTAQYAVRGGHVFASAGIPLTRMLVSSRHVAQQAGRGPSSVARHPLTAWIGLSPEHRWSGVAATVPRKFRPSPLNLIFKPLRDGVPMPDVASTLFESLDFDAY